VVSRTEYDEVACGAARLCGIRLTADDFGGVRPLAMRPHSFFFHPIHQQSTTREPVKGFALLRFATALTRDGTPLTCCAGN
jgi:hypothetical protein